MRSFAVKPSRMLAVLPLCVALMAGAFSARADWVESHPDWAAIATAGKVTIGANQAYIVYESDMQYVNSLAGQKITLEGALILDNVETGLRENIFAEWLDHGTLIKRGNSTPSVECPALWPQRHHAAHRRCRLQCDRRTDRRHGSDRADVGRVDP